MVRTITSHPSGRNCGLAVPAHADKSQQGLLFLLSSLEQERACSTQVSRGVESYSPPPLLFLVSSVAVSFWQRLAASCGKSQRLLVNCVYEWVAVRELAENLPQLQSLDHSLLSTQQKNVQRIQICFHKEKKKEGLYWLNTQNMPGRKA